MLRPRFRFYAIAALAAVCFVLGAQTFSPKLYQAMRWRQIGPFRAGRVTAVAGIPGNAAVYYMGTPGGGVWKTIDGGMVWTPIFDQVPRRLRLARSQWRRRTRTLSTWARAT